MITSKEPIMSRNERRFSSELLPTKTEVGHKKLLVTARNLADYKPDFFSYTYSAGGSTRDRTSSTVLQLDDEVKVPITPHLSCIGDLETELRELLGRYREAGIRHIIVLCGDLPSDTGTASGKSRCANELVDFTRIETGNHFHIGVAAYPEAHPQTYSFEDDLANFARKAKADASSAITQYFSNANAYFYFIERVAKLGMDIPAIPDIMPIANYSKLVCFSDTCGAELPRWIHKQLEAYGDDGRSIQAFGEQVISETCERLLEGGAPGLHLYTLNQADSNLTIWKNLQLPR